MLLRPWLETRAPRYALDDDDYSSSEEDNSKEQIGRVDIKLRPGSTPEKGHVLVCIPKCFEALLGGFISKKSDKTVVGSIQISENVHAEIVTSSLAKDSNNKDIYWIVFPTLDASICYIFAKFLVDQLSPSKLIVVAPKQNYQDPVQILVSSNYNNVGKKWPRLRSPSFILGPAASLASLGQLNSIKTGCIVVEAYGIPGHEFLEMEPLTQVVGALGDFLGISTSDIFDYEHVRHLLVRPTGMYL